MNRSFSQIALTAALLLTLGLSTSFAANTTDNGGVTASFRKDFKQAELLSVVDGKDYTKVTFKMNGVILSAFYKDNGELLAVTHNIASSQLPINLLLQVKHNYADCWISDCFEIDTNGSASLLYYLGKRQHQTYLFIPMGTIGKPIARSPKISFSAFINP